MPVGPRARSGAASRPRPELKKKAYPELKKKPVASEPRDEPRAEPEPDTEPDAAWYQHPAIAVAAVVLFFPLGLVLVSQTRWSTRAKAAVLGSGAAVLAVLLLLALLRSPGSPTMVNAGAGSNTTLVSDSDAPTTVPLAVTGSTVAQEPVPSEVAPEGPVESVPVPGPGPAPAAPNVPPSTIAGGVAPTPTTARVGGLPGGNPPPSTPQPTLPNTTAPPIQQGGRCHKAYSDAGKSGTCVPPVDFNPANDRDCVGTDDGIGINAEPVSGPLPMSLGNPQDVFGLDRNNDGVACGTGD